jgi:tetratricopeptide (TPR) repeat protein
MFEEVLCVSFCQAYRTKSASTLNADPMDTLSFDFLQPVDDSVGTARAAFDRREFREAIAAIAGLPEFLQAGIDILELKAKSHDALGQHLEAIAVWEQLLRADPAHKLALNRLPIAYSKLGADEIFKEPKAKFRLNKWKETLEALESGPAEWRRHPEFLRMKGICHQKLGQFDSALAAWRQLAALSPGNVESQVRVPVCLAGAGKAAEAGLAFKQVAERYPDNVEARFNWLFFRLANQRNAPAVVRAIEEIAYLRITSRNSEEFRTQFDLLRTRLLAIFDPRELAAHDRENVFQLAEPVAESVGGMRAIYEQFEPVGNNCEFGFAQRQHGAEPLSLFRWTSITPGNLVRLLADGFENYEAPECYRLDRNSDRELILREDAYGTASHTQLKAADIDTAALLDRLARRQAFLKRKFLQTLADGRKAFVYKYDQRLDIHTIQAIRQGLAAMGARKFLFVMRAEGDDKPGTVRIQSADCVVGFLSDFLPNTQFHEWDAIVKQTHAHFERAA